MRELRNMVERLMLLADGAVDAALGRLALPAADGEAVGLERSHLYKKCQALGIDLRAMRSGGQ